MADNDIVKNQQTDLTNVNQVKTANAEVVDAPATEPVYTDEEEVTKLEGRLGSKYSIKWQTEIDLHRSIDTAIILEGNVNDDQVYYIGNEFSMAPTEKYLYDYLKSIGYETVVFFSHIDGFFNKYDKNELKRFKRILHRAESEDETESTGIATCSRFGAALEDIRMIMENKESAVAIIMCDVSRYISNPSYITEADHFLFSKLNMSTKTKRVFANGLHNIMFLIAEKSNDIPAWFYLNNPRVKTITIPAPDRNIRRLYIDGVYDDFDGNSGEEAPEEIERNKELFVSYTDGFRLVDLESLKILMNREEIPVAKISKGVSKFKYGIEDNPWEDDSLRSELSKLEEILKRRVKGQDSAVAKASAIIKSAVLGLAGLQHSSSKSKPRGVMFLAGPTGTGKTELAKAISEWIFKSDSHVIRFDMSEYSQSHTDQRLLGAPPGYVGYEQGGQLTEAVKKDPFAVLLFDEIEKAHPSIMDKFLQILEDGRMTDGKGETVYFSDSLIIFTSNLGMIQETEGKDGKTIKYKVPYGCDGCNEENEEIAEAKYEEYTKLVLGGIDKFFVENIQRPELKNRIGENFIVFDFISYEASKKIAQKQLDTIIRNIKEQKNIVLKFTTGALEQLHKEISKEEHISQGGRGVGNVIENMVLRPLSNYLVENLIWGDDTIEVAGFRAVKGNWKLFCSEQ